MSALAWTAAQVCAVTPGVPRRPDVIEVTAEYVVHLMSAVTADDIAAHFRIDKTGAARRLRIAAERGLLRRIDPTRKSRAVQYVAPARYARRGA